VVDQETGEELEDTRPPRENKPRGPRRDGGGGRGREGGGRGRDGGGRGRKPEASKDGGGDIPLPSSITED
ncbi:MAG: hypothetical protein ABJC40_08750, partial [Parasphingorhabdus sp.]